MEIAEKRGWKHNACLKDPDKPIQDLSQPLRTTVPYIPTTAKRISCVYGLCRSHGRYGDVMDVTFIPFPKLGKNPMKCETWAAACGREDFSIYNITSNTYICSKHFLGGRGPTDEHPDPIPCDPEKELLTPNSRGRKRILLKKPNEAPTPQQLAENDRMNESEQRERITGDSRQIEGSNTEESEAVNESDKPTTQVVFIRVHPRAMIDPDPETRLDLDKLHSALLGKRLREWSLKLTESELTIFTSNSSAILTSVVVNAELYILVKVLNRFLPENHELSRTIPNKAYDFKTVRTLLQKLQTWDVCGGNNEEKFQCIARSVSSSGMFLWQTEGIHSKKCSLLFRKKGQRSRCSFCQKFRRVLNSTLWRVSHPRVPADQSPDSDKDHTEAKKLKIASDLSEDSLS